MQQLLRLVLIPAAIGVLAGWLMLRYGTNQRDIPAPNSYANAAEVASPSVVSIYSSKTARPPFCQLPAYREWCASLGRGGAMRRESSLGSGVVVRKDGYIVTNEHVITGADEILVALPDGEFRPASLVGTDSETDLAVIRVATNDLTPLEFADSNAAHVGDVVLAIGNPYGIGQTVSQGIISALGRDSISSSPYDEFIQTDAAINPGNSGGALVNTDGRLVGINTMIFSRSGGSQGIGFAIPSALAVTVLNDLLRFGHVRRSWLGIEVEEAKGGQAGYGFRISGLTPGGPAERAGLQTGDVLLALDAHMPPSTAAVGRYIGALEPGSRTVLSIERNGEVLRLTATTAERPRSS
ncbi:MAG: trypsin-like peptidase domain-containing protein [Pseudomonadales bacterium]